MNVPFGLLFEENIRETEGEIPKSLYSSTQQMTYIVLETGDLQPYVTTAWMMGTETATKVKAEGTVDDDQKPKVFTTLLDTQTITNVRAETTDSDANHPSFHKTETLLLGTETDTRVRTESTDSDR